MLSLARISMRRPRLCLALLAVVTAACAVLLPRLELRTDGAVLHPAHEPAVLRTTADRAVFRDPEEVVLLLAAEAGGPRLSSATGLRALRRAHRAVAALPGIRGGGVRSAASAIDVATSSVGTLGRFLDTIPEEPSARAELLDRLRRQPLTDGLLLAPDGSAAAIYAPLAPGGDRQQLARQLERWAATYEEDGFELGIAGPVIAETLLGERILGDLARLVPVMIAVVGALLLLCLRSAAGLLIPLVKTLVVLLWTGGAMALTAIPVTLVTTILPVLLLALCVTDEIHLLARFQRRLADPASRIPEADRRGRDDVLLSTLVELRRPVVFTSLSTAIGFLSFLSASIVPLRHFGTLAALGILLAMLLSFTLTPALAVLLPQSWFVPWGRTPSGTRQGDGDGRPPVRRWTAALVVGLLLLAAGVPGLLRLSVQDSWVANFDPGSPLVQAERRLNAAFWGTYRFDVVLDGPPGLFHRPAGAALAAAASRRAAAAPQVGGVVTYLQPLNTVAQLLGLATPAGALDADTLEAAVQVAGHYRQRTGLERLLTADGAATRLLVVVNSPDYLRGRALSGHLDRELAALLAGSGVAYHFSGDLPLALATVRAIVGNQLRSIAWTLAGVAVLLLVANRSWRLTALQLLPPLTAAWLILAGMGYAGLPLGVATSLFTALTLGVGVDFALHLTSAYQHQRARGLQAAHAAAAALEVTAPGRRWSTLVLAVGFLVLTVSALSPNHDLGLLLAAAMLASHLTTWLFVPRLLATDPPPRSSQP